MKYEKNRKIFGMDEYTFLKYLKILIIPIVIIILIAIFLIADFIMSKKDRSTDNINESIATMSESISEEIAENEIPEINELILEYQNAMLNADENALYNIFREELPSNTGDLSEKMKLYQSYENTKIYSFTGLDDNSYVVFIHSDIKFKDVESLVPSLSYAYVIKDENGYYMKNPNSLDTTELARIDEIKNTAFIKELESDISMQLSNALVNDARLANIYKILLGIESADDIFKKEEAETVPEETMEEAEIIVETGESTETE